MSRFQGMGGVLSSGWQVFTDRNGHAGGLATTNLLHRGAFGESGGPRSPRTGHETTSSDANRTNRLTSELAVALGCVSGNYSKITILLTIASRSSVTVTNQVLASAGGAGATMAPSVRVAGTDVQSRSLRFPVPVV